jgi:HEAT repeat protein
MSATDGDAVDLSDLDNVGWSSLQHAYGSAEDVPALIRSLVSSDPEVRKQAIYDAFGSIWHQGTIYEATVEAVPFLVRIAVTAGVPDRGRVIELLAAIAAGTGYVSAHRSMMTRVDDWSAGELDAHEANERLHIEAIGGSLAQAAPDLVMLLDDPDTDVRSAVCWLLGRIPARAGFITAALLGRYGQESDDLCRAAELLAIGDLAQGESTASRSEVLASGAVAGGATAVAAAMVRAVVATDDDERIVACQDFTAALGNGGDPISQLAVVGEANGPESFMAAIVGPRPGVQAVLEASLLRASDASRRRTAVHLATQRALVSRAATPASLALVTEAASDPDEEVRRRAVRALCNLYPASASAAEVFASSLDDPPVQGLCAIAAANLGDRKAYRVIAAAAKTSDPPEWIGEALQALGQGVEPLVDDIVKLINRLQRVPRRKVGVDNRLVQTVGSLAAVRDPSRKVLRLLDDLLDDARAILQAARVLGSYGPGARRSVAALRNHLARTDDVYARASLGFAIWRASSDARPLFEVAREQLFPGKPRLIFEYLEPLGPGASDLAPRIEPLMREGDAWQQVAAARAYWKITGDTAKALPVLADHAVVLPVGLKVVEALAWLGPAASFLAERLQSWLDLDRRLGVPAPDGEIVATDEAFRAAIRTTLLAIA